jgi:hypothetical protein
MSVDSFLVGILTRLHDGVPRRRSSESEQEGEMFLFVKIFKLVLPHSPQSPLRRVLGTMSPREERPGRKADHSPNKSTNFAVGKRRTMTKNLVMHY